MFIKKWIRKNYKLIKEMFNIVLPSVIDLLAQALLSAIDMMMVGGLGALAISSVGLGSVALNTIAPGLMAVGIGTSALLSRAYGAGDVEEAKRSVTQSLFISVFLGTIITVLFLIFSKEILTLISRSGNMDLALAKVYQDITTYGIFFLGFNVIFVSTYRTIGKTAIPMIANITSLILHIILNYLFINILGMGVFGAGLSTTISRGISTLFYIYLTFFTKKYWVSLSRKDLNLNTHMISRIIKVSIPAAIEQLSLRFGMLIFEMMIISLGTLSYAAHRITSTAEAFSYNIAFAFSIAATTLVGQQLGKNSPKEASKNGFICTYFAVGILSTMGLLFFIMPELIISMFTKEADVRTLSASALRIVSICQPFTAASMVLNGSLRGAGATKSVLYITFIGVFLIRIPIAYFFIYVFKTGLIGAWIIMTIDWSFRAAVGYFIFKRGKWRYITV